VSTSAVVASKNQINVLSYINTEHSYAAPKPILVDNSIAMSDDANIWVKVKDISLTNGDKRILASDQMLTNKCSTAIVEETFPKINGLRFTLLQN